MYLIKYGEEATIYGLKLLDRTTQQFKSNPTLAAGDVKLSKDGGTLTNLGTLPTLSPASSTEVKVILSATESQCKIATVNFRDAAGEEWDDNAYHFFTYGDPLAYLPFDFSTAGVSLLPAQVQQLADAPWGAMRADNADVGTFGEGVASVQGNLTGVVGTVTALSTAERDAIAAALLDLAAAIETGLTVRQSLRLVTAGAAGKLSGADTTTVTIRNAAADSKNRIVATVDEFGNRSDITLDVT